MILSKTRRRGAGEGNYGEACEDLRLGHCFDHNGAFKGRVYLMAYVKTYQNVQFAVCR